MDCKINGCHRVARRKKKALCNYHESVERGIQCSIDGCVEPSVTVKNPLCSRHWQRNKLGLPMNKDKRQYGDSYIANNGYVIEYVPGHKQAFNDGRALQHRRMYADFLGRKLKEFENIHHKNGNRADNRLENLELWITKQPNGQRPEDLLVWAKWILEEYGNE